MRIPRQILAFFLTLAPSLFAVAIETSAESAVCHGGADAGYRSYGMRPASEAATLASGSPWHRWEKLNQNEIPQFPTHDHDSSKFSPVVFA